MGIISSGPQSSFAELIVKIGATENTTATCTYVRTEPIDADVEIQQTNQD